uniref:Uncharacterized protein n=1 Tax=Romanomermis culicivorax TaxID=13658 RepID=A0A915JDN5_ROMCU
MARQAKIEATVGGSVKGHQTLERQRPRMPPKIVHPMAETLDKIERELKPVWKSNLVDMNFDERYELEMANWVPREDRRERVNWNDL